ncbi:MAG: 2OG-Fe(II) oxygenase, partial [Methylovulum sp.]
ICFDALKNTDAAIADVLVTAARQTDCDIHLALVSIEESGDAEYTGYGRYHDDDAFEVGEVYERTETVSDWRRPDGSEPELPTLPFAETECCPPDVFENLEFDDVQFHEATGNAGASFERTYYCAALVLWPHNRYLAIINQAGFSAALAMLQELCQNYEAAGDKTQASSHWQDAHRLAGYMLRDWLRQCLGSKSAYSRLQEFLECLYRLQDSQHIARFWSLFAENGIDNKDDCAMLVQVAELLPWSQVVEGLTRAVSISAANKAQEACAALLASFSQAYPDTAKDLSAAARVLFEALPGDAARFAHLNPWEHTRMTVNEGMVVDVLTGFSGIDAALAETALDYLLAWPDTYNRDAVLAPAALRLAEAGASRNLSVAVRLRLAVIAHVQKRVAEDLNPPADWRRDSQLKCNCKDCTELRLFLDDPHQDSWRFKAAENRREHVTQTISRHLCDVDQKTEKLSRPYSLICTKNQASYLRRVAQRQKDLDTLARLGVEGVVNER